MNLKSNKGSITLFVVIAMLAFVFFTIATYTLLSRRNQTQIGLTKGVKEIYGDLAEDAEYASYFKGEVVPIYTADELKQVCSGRKIAIDKEDGKIYTFSANATYVLKNDINLNDGKYTQNEDGSFTFSDDAEVWTPIGTEVDPFTGFFEGMGYTISGLYIKDPENDYQGLFGCIDGGIVNNLKVSGSIKSTESNIGGIVGQVKGKYKIRKCINKVTVSGKNNVGGIVGVVSTKEESTENGSIENCSNNGMIVGTNYVGGIIGNDNRSTFIAYCGNYQNIQGEQYVGGIVGSITSGSILNSSNIGSVTGNITNEDLNGGIGGIAGISINGNIKLSFNEGIVKGYISGGIIGNNQGIVENCYNKSAVLESKYAGGISGIQAIESAKLLNCYNIGEISLVQNGQAGGIVANKNDNSVVENCNYLSGTCVGGINGNDIKQKAEVRSDEFMKSKYFVMDLGTENWKIVDGINNGYPILYWQEGEKAEPEFTTVSTAQALKDFAHIVNDLSETFEGKTVMLLKNIDLSTVCSATLGNWEPIGNYGVNENLHFDGTFEGNNKTISNLYINNDSKDYQGLFGYTINSNIKNIIIENVKITGRYNIGSIVGINNGSIYNIHVNSGAVNGMGAIGGITGIVNGYMRQCSNHANIISNSVSEEDWAIGGISGGSYTNGKIESCVNYGTISGQKYVGGIVGVNWCHTLNCYNVGTIKANNDNLQVYLGGITGYQNLENGRLENCYNIGKIEIDSNIGSGAQIIAGYELGSVQNCYYLEGINSLKGICFNQDAWNQDAIGQAEVRSAEFMKSKYFVTDLGAENWKIVEGVNNGYPILNWQEGEKVEPEFTTVSTAQALKDFAHIVNDLGETFEGKTVTLQNSIDLSTVCSETLGNWTPIGNYEVNENLHFSGIFNGNNQTISNIYINSTTADYQSLFGAVNNSSIINITITGNITANVYVGGIVAKNDNGGNISNCKNYVNVTGLRTIGGIVGGIIGGTGVINNCDNYGIIYSDKSNTNSNYIGGIAGICQAETISGCKNYGNVTGAILVGGISGISNTDNISIINCQNEATITGDTYIAGIAGRNDGITDMCNNSGNVNCTETLNYTHLICGGIVGRAKNNISKCVNSGNINAVVSHTQGQACIVGGISGYLSGEVATISLSSNTGNIQAKNNHEVDVEGNPSPNYIGGIVGQLSGNLENCYNIAKIIDSYKLKGSNTNNASGIVGGFVNGSITNCYNNTTITAQCGDSKTPYIGSIAVAMINDTETMRTININNSYYLSGTASVGVYNPNTADNFKLTGSAVEKSVSDMTNQNFVNTLGIENWKIVAGENEGYPILSWQ